MSNNSLCRKIEFLKKRYDNLPEQDEMTNGEYYDAIIAHIKEERKTEIFRLKKLVDELIEKDNNDDDKLLNTFSKILTDKDN